MSEMKKMKALSIRVAQRCEDALEDACKCRCGGKLHGARRGKVMNLPFSDPHSPARDCPSCGGKGERKFFDLKSGGGSTYKCEKCKGTGKVLPKEKPVKHHPDCEPSPYVFPDGSTEPQCHEDCPTLKK